MQRIIFNKVVPNVFREQTITSDVWDSEITFEKGKVYLVLANSGKGKSTFCSYILGYRSDYAGTIMFDDINIRSFSIKNWSDIRRNSVSNLFQELRLFPELTAMENIMIKNNLSCCKNEDEIKCWFRELGIEDKMYEKVGVMSFGQQQRVAMMRSLVQPFDFLIVDEPISHLDDTNSAVMANIMMREARKQGACVIVTSIGKHMDLVYDKTYML